MAGESPPSSSAGTASPTPTTTMERPPPVRAAASTTTAGVAPPAAAGESLDAPLLLSGRSLSPDDVSGPPTQRASPVCSRASPATTAPPISAADLFAQSSAAIHNAEGDDDDSSEDDNPFQGRCMRLSPNVWRAVLFTTMANFSCAVWGMSVWSPFLKAIFNNNLDVGIVAAASGLGEFAAALISGFASDRLGREPLLRFAAAVGFAAVAGIALGVHYEHFATLIVASVLSGASYGAFFPVVEALFADSVPVGNRTFIYNVKYGLETFSYVAAYIVALVLFAIVGDSWEVPTMKLVIHIGLGLMGVTTFILFSIREKYALPKDFEKRRATRERRRRLRRQQQRQQRRRQLQQQAGSSRSPVYSPTTQGTIISFSSSASPNLTPMLHPTDQIPHINYCGPLACTEHSNLTDADRRVSALDAITEDDQDQAVAEAAVNATIESPETAWYRKRREEVLRKAPGLIPQRRLPLLIALRDVVICLGSGMTVMYMSLFLIHYYQVSPVLLQIVFMSCSAASMLFSQLLGAVVGDSGWCKTHNKKPRFNRIRVLVVPTAFARRR